MADLKIIKAKIVNCTDSVMNTLLRLKLIRCRPDTQLKTDVYIGPKKIGDVIVFSIQEAAEGGECDISLCVDNVYDIPVKDIETISITSSQQIYTDKESGVRLFPPYFQVVNIEKRA